MMEYLGEGAGGIDAATGSEPGGPGGHMGCEMGLQRREEEAGVAEGKEADTAQKPGRGRKRESWNPTGGSLIRLALRDVL